MVDSRIEIPDGPVDSDASRFRDIEYIVQFQAIPGVTCPRCGSGEVWHPMQTCDLPMYVECLRCGIYAPSQEFHEP